MARPEVLVDHDDGDDSERPAIGPGRRRRTPGPNIEAYADGAIDRDCPTCYANPLQFCRYPNGIFKKLPCPQRLRETTAP